MRDPKYNGLMGMFEMEEAVRVMDEYAQSQGVSLAECSFSVRQFLPPCDARKINTGSSEIDAIVGLCHMLINEWMEADYPNNLFTPHKDLIQRLNKKWGTNYPDPVPHWKKITDSLPKLEEKKDELPNNDSGSSLP